LEPRCNIDAVAVDICAVRYRVTRVDPHTEADATIGWLTAIKLGYTRLYLDREAHCREHARELHQQRVASCIVDFPAIPLERWINEDLAKAR
jgi:hypothetical protein